MFKPNTVKNKNNLNQLRMKNFCCCCYYIFLFTKKIAYMYGGLEDEQFLFLKLLSLLYIQKKTYNSQVRLSLRYMKERSAEIIKKKTIYK